MRRLGKQLTDYIIWGMDPKTDKPSCYALYVPDDEREEYLQRAKDAGWTGLIMEVKQPPRMEIPDTEKGPQEPAEKVGRKGPERRHNSTNRIAISNTKQSRRRGPKAR